MSEIAFINNTFNHIKYDVEVVVVGGFLWGTA